MKHLYWILFFLLCAAGVFGQFQDPPPANLARYMESYNQLDAYNKWKGDNYVYDRFIANVNKETKGVRWKFCDKYAPYSCYQRLGYFSSYLYKRKIGKARVCMTGDSALGIKIWMDLDRSRVRKLRDFVKMPNIFNHTLERKNIAKYEKTAENISEQVYKDVIKDEPVEYNQFVMIYLRAKKCEKTLCCILVRRAGQCCVKASYFLPGPLY